MSNALSCIFSNKQINYVNSAKHSKWFFIALITIAVVNSIIIILGGLCIFGIQGSSGFIASIVVGGIFLFIAIGGILQKVIFHKQNSSKSTRNDLKKTDSPDSLNIKLIDKKTDIDSQKINDEENKTTSNYKNLNSIPTRPINQHILNNTDIIENLNKQNYEGPIEVARDGRCLFWSILPQITDQDLQYALSTGYAAFFKNWGALPESDNGDDRLQRLRLVALAEEKNFLNSIDYVDHPDKNFTLYQKERIFELYKDMLQEIEGLYPHQILQRIKDESGDNAIVISNTRLLYCKTNFYRYSSSTAKKYNWAGTSELSAIGSVFGRSVELFGIDLYPHTNLDEENNVLPFYSAYINVRPETIPITIFQIPGGGHYQRLRKILPEENMLFYIPNVDQN